MKDNNMNTLILPSNPTIDDYILILRKIVERFDEMHSPEELTLKKDEIAKSQEKLDSMKPGTDKLKFREYLANMKRSYSMLNDAFTKRNAIVDYLNGESDEHDVDLFGFSIDWTNTKLVVEAVDIPWYKKYSQEIWITIALAIASALFIVIPCYIAATM